MFSIELQSLAAEARGLRSYLRATNNMRAMFAAYSEKLEPTIIESQLHEIHSQAPESVRWRILQHSLVVGHLYAIYERFCENMLRDWISFLTGHLKFEDLPEKIINSYPIGFSVIAGMLPSPRYPLLRIESLVENYNSALQGKKNYILDPECLIHHKNNLRFEELAELFGKCGIEGLRAWIDASDVISEHFDGMRGRLADQVSAKLRGFIQYRNDSSHGVVEVDEILGEDDLIELINFIECFATSINQIVLWNGLKILHREGQAFLLGTVTEVFKKANAVICVTQGNRIEVGQKVFIKKDGSIFESAITSMQLNGSNITSINPTVGTELGLQLGELPLAGGEIYSYIP